MVLFYCKIHFFSGSWILRVLISLLLVAPILCDLYYNVKFDCSRIKDPSTGITPCSWLYVEKTFWNYEWKQQLLSKIFSGKAVHCNPTHTRVSVKDVRKLEKPKQRRSKQLLDLHSTSLCFYNTVCLHCFNATLQLYAPFLCGEHLRLQKMPSPV